MNPILISASFGELKGTSAVHLPQRVMCFMDALCIELVTNALLPVMVFPHSLQ